MSIHTHPHKTVSINLSFHKENTFSELMGGRSGLCTAGELKSKNKAYGAFSLFCLAFFFFYMWQFPC